MTRTTEIHTHQHTQAQGYIRVVYIQICSLINVCKHV